MLPQRNTNPLNSFLAGLFKVLIAILSIAIKYPIASFVLVMASLFGARFVNVRPKVDPVEEDFSVRPSSFAEITFKLADRQPETCAAISDEFIFGQIMIAKDFAKQLTPQQQLAKRQLAWAYVKEIMQEPETHEKVVRAFASKDFKLIIESELINNDLAQAGVTKDPTNGKQINCIKVRVDNLGCHKISRHLRHEFHHKDIHVVKSNNDPIGDRMKSFFEGKDALMSVDPYDTPEEQAELEDALKKCDQYITQEFAALRIKALEGALTPLEIEHHNSLVKLIEEKYQPICVRVPQYALSYMPIAKMEKELAEGFPFVRVGSSYDIYVTHVVHHQNRTAIYGYLVNEPQTTNGKVAAFIADNEYRKTQEGIEFYNHGYQKDGKRTMLMEKDAQRHEDDPEIIKTFCPEFYRFHQKRLAKFDKFSHQRVDAPTPRLR